MSSVLNLSVSFDNSEQSIDSEAGIIRGVSLITCGNVLGHNCWADKKTLQTVYECASKVGKVKTKINHGADASSVIGYLEKFRILGDQVKADLILLKNSPHFKYVLELARELSSQIGLSIAFKPKFDKINKKDFVRCEEIFSADWVDAPAANPNGLFSKDMKKVKDDTKKTEDQDEKVIDTDTKDTDAEKEEDKEDLSKEPMPKKDDDEDPDKDGDDDSKDSKDNPDKDEDEKEDDDCEMSNKELVKLVKSLEARFIAGMPTAAIQTSVNSPESSDVNTIGCKNCQDTSHVLDSLNELHNTATVMIAEHKKKIEDHNQKLNGLQDQLEAITKSISKFSEFENQIKVVVDVVEALNTKLNEYQLEFNTKFEKDREEFSTRLENQKTEFETQLKDADLLACRKLAATGVPISKIPSAEVSLSVVNPIEQFNAIVNPVEKAQFWKEHGAKIKKAFQEQANKINTSK